MWSSKLVMGGVEFERCWWGWDVLLAQVGDAEVEGRGYIAARVDEKPREGRI